MNLLIVSGFLGSGKTTLILAMARKLVETNRTVAIIENEVGEIGIDGDLIARSGFTLRELFNGCICCQLSADVVPALESLAQEFSPDFIIIEPSGIAEPDRILEVLHYYRGPTLNAIQTITLVDPTRLEDLATVLSPLINAQIRPASTVVINKIDLASPAELVFARQLVSEINPGARVITLNARQGIDPATLEQISLMR